MACQLCTAAGRVEDILQTYDRERRVLPPPVRMWEWGWTKSAETWNGRIASVPFITMLAQLCELHVDASCMLTRHQYACIFMSVGLACMQALHVGPYAAEKHI